MEKKDSQIFVWGSNRFGQLGIQKDDEVYEVPRICTFQIQVEKLACGKEHSAILTTDGYLYTMGNNKNGQLGISNRQCLFFQSPQLVETLQRFKIVEIACGGFHTAAVTDEGDLFTWGDNSFGQLGVNSYEDFFTPQMVNFNGDNMFLQVVQVSCGMLHTIILLYDHTIHAFGNGEFGQLGLGDTKCVNTPTYIETLGDKVIQIAAGYQHSLYICYSGQIMSTGFNQQGQLGQGHFNNVLIPHEVCEDARFKKVAASSYSVGLSQKGEIYFFGNCAWGQFSTPKKYDGGIFLQMALGFHFGMVVDQQYQVHSWGINNSRQQLVEELDVCAPFSKLYKMNGVMVQQIACGFNFVIAVGEAVAMETHQTPILNRSRAYIQSSPVMRIKETVQSTPIQFESSKELTSEEINKRRRTKDKTPKNELLFKKQETFSDVDQRLFYTQQQANVNQHALLVAKTQHTQQHAPPLPKSPDPPKKQKPEIKQEQPKITPSIHQVQYSLQPFPPNLPLSEDVIQRIMKSKDDSIQSLNAQLSSEQQAYKSSIQELIEVHQLESASINVQLDQKNDEIERYKNIVQTLENQLNLVNNEIKDSQESKKKLTKEHRYSTSQLKYSEEKYCKAVQQFSCKIKDQQQEIQELQKELKKYQN